MKNELHQWLDRKPAEKVSVRVAKKDIRKPARSVRQPSAVQMDFSDAGLTDDIRTGDKLQNMEPPNERQNVQVPGKRHASPFLSATDWFIAGGAVLTGLLMGWTLWAFFMPL